jgi:hypothetical protein
MIHDHHDCVRSAINLLIAVSEALSGEANTVLRERIDEAVRQLSTVQEIEHFETRRISEVLRILGEGLALIPSIVEFVQKLNR